MIRPLHTRRIGLVQLHVEVAEKGRQYRIHFHMGETVTSLASPRLKLVVRRWDGLFKGVRGDLME